jgi:thiamine transporter
MLCEGAILIALALVLGMWKLYEFPNGGSISLEMLPLFIFIARWGLGSGLVGCFAFGVLQIFVQGAVSWGWVSMILDFIVAFGVMGLGGIFRGKIYPAAILASLARFVVHFISGVTVYKILVPTDLLGMTFSNPWLYSLVYNGSYMVVDLILCLVVIALLMASPVKKYLKAEDLK